MQFLYPQFLYASLLVAIPILIHFLKLRKYKTVYFSNVSFLYELKKEKEAKSKIKEWLILIARILTILCLVFVFAQPYIPQSNVHSNTRYHSIYIDNSFSMQLMSEDGSLLEQAKQAALSLANKFPVSDKYQLLTNDFLGEDHAFVSQEEFIEKVKRVDFSPLSRTWTEVLGRMKSLLPNQVQSDYYLLSDFQKSTLGLPSTWQDSSSTVVCMPLFSQNINNLSLDSLYMDLPVQLAETERVLTCIVHNHSENLVENVSVKLFVNGKELGGGYVDIAGNSSEVVNFPFKMKDSTFIHGYVEIQDFPIVFDNRLYFSFNPSPQPNVLEIYEQEPNLSLGKLFGDDPHYVFTSFPIKSLNYNLISTADFIVLSQVENLSPTIQLELEKRIKNGGRLLISPAVNGYGKEFNQWTLAAFGFEYGNKDTVSFNVQTMYKEHPIFKQAMVGHPKNIELPWVDFYIPFSKSQKYAYQPLLSLHAQVDFLAQLKVEKGQVFLLSTPMLDKYTTFTKQFSFVIALVNMALLQAEPISLYYTLGERVGIPLRSALTDISSGCEIQSLDGDFSLIPELKKQGGNLWMMIYGQITQSGNYRLKQKNKEIEGFSFNENRKESNLNFYTTSELKKILSNYQGVFVWTVQTKGISNATEAVNLSRDLWKIFLIFALIFIMAEVLLIRFWKL